MIEISSRDDIVIPFNKIGDPDWETKTRLILASFADLNGDEIAEPIHHAEIASLEQRLKTTLPESLKLFYLSFGIADIGEELQQFDDIGYLHDIWAKAPQYSPDFTEADLKVLPDLITFSDYLGNGNMFCFHRESKEIYYFDHDSKPYLTKLFACVDDYLKGCLLFAQVDLFGDAQPDQVDQWIDEIVMDLFGKNTIHKWRY